MTVYPPPPFPYSAAAGVLEQIGRDVGGGALADGPGARATLKAASFAAAVVFFLLPNETTEAGRLSVSPSHPSYCSWACRRPGAESQPEFPTRGAL